MPDVDAAAKFEGCLEAALARITDQRVHIILRMIAASIGVEKLDRLQQELDRLPNDSPNKKLIEFDRIAEQLAAVAPQIVALDLDRATPLRIVGIGRATTTALFCAKVLDHDVTVVCRDNHFLTNRLLKLFEVPRFDPMAAGGMPEGQFDLVISFGGPNLSTRRNWADFVLPLADRLTDGGRVFVALANAPNPKKNYYPDMVISKLAKMGAKVSSKNYFVLLEKALIKKFGPEAAVAAETSDPLAPKAPEDQPVVDPEIAAVDRKEPARTLKLLRKTTTLMAGVVVLVGLFVVTWVAR